MNAVSVATPWETITYIPPGSLIYLNCTSEEIQHLEWSITLSGTRNLSYYDVEESIRVLNSHGIYKLPKVEKTIQLLINNTDGNNGTEILCVDVASLGKALSETTLMNIGRLYSLMHYLITYNVIPCSLVKLCPPCSYNYCSAYYNQLKCD